MVSFGRALAYTLVYMIGSFTFGFITIFPNPGVRSMSEQWPFFYNIVDSDSIRYFSSFAPLFASLGGFLVHFLIRYVFKNQKRIVICILNIFGLIIWLLFLLITPEKWWIGILLRSLQGLVLGGNATITPMIILEVAPFHSKGMFGGFAQIGKTSGFLIYYIAGAFSNWKTMVIIGAVFCLIESVFIWFTPEQNDSNAIIMEMIENNRKQLDLKIREKKSKRSKKKYCKCNCNCQCNCGCKHHFKHESIFQRRYIFNLFSGMMMMIFQQFCGINAINANLTNILTNSGLRIDPNLKSAISTTAQWLAVFVSSFILDACGRKIIWILSAAGVTIGLAMYSVSLRVNIHGWYAALCVFLIMIFFGFGFGPIPWFIGYEMFPSEVRMMGQSMINFAAMIATFAIAFINPIMNEKFGEFYVIVIYMLITFIGFIFGFWFVKDPEEINDEITVL